MKKTVECPRVACSRAGEVMAGECRAVQESAELCRKGGSSSREGGKGFVCS